MARSSRDDGARYAQGTTEEGPEARRARDQSWVEGIRAGDESAFEGLFRTYYPRLCAFAAGYVGSSEVAEEITSDVFVRIWEIRADWDVRDSVRSYLYTAVRNRSLTQRERERVRRRARDVALSEGLSPAMGQAPMVADVALEARELAEQIESAIAGLPERSREAFLLHRRHGLTYAEVGVTMRIAPRTVEVHIRRALAALREALQSHVTR